MNSTRRGFIAASGASILFLLMSAVSATSLLTGCNPIDIFTQIAIYVPIGLAAVSGIVALIPGLGAAAPILVLVKAGFADLLAAVQAYQAAPAADKATLLAKITLFLSDIITNFQAFIAALSIPGPLAILVEALATLLISTLQAFLNKISATPTPTQVHLRVAAKQVTVAAKYRTAKQFKAEYNATANAAGHSEIDIR